MVPVSMVKNNASHCHKRLRVILRRQPYDIFSACVFDKSARNPERGNPQCPEPCWIFEQRKIWSVDGPEVPVLIGRFLDVVPEELGVLVQRA
jgi:hypothetical protein